MMNFCVIRFFYTSYQKMFEDEIMRLVFYRLLEKYLMQKLPVFSWSLSENEALCLTVTREQFTEVRNNAGILMETYTSYRRHRDNSLPVNLESEIICVPYVHKVLCEKVVALHCWPLLQGLGSNFVEYPWTSYLLILGKQHPHLQSETVLKWFGNKQKFRHEHLKLLEKKEVLKNVFGNNLFNFMEEKEKI